MSSAKAQEWRHWTPAGVFALKPEHKLGMIIYELYHEDKLLGVFTEAWQGAADLAHGKFDDQSGVTAATLGIPSNHRDWNMLR